MRVLIVVHGYPPTYAGGAELRAARTGQALLARGHAVRALAVESLDPPDGHPAYHDCEQDGIAVRRLFLRRRRDEEQLAWEDDNPQTAQALSDLIVTWRPDVIHLFSGYLMTGSIIRVANEFGVPIVVSLTDFWWLCHRINLLRADGSRCSGPTPAGCARCRGEIYRRFRLPSSVWKSASDTFWRQGERIQSLGRVLKMEHYAARLHASVAALNQVDALIAPSRFLADFYCRYGVKAERIRIWRQGVDIDRCPIPTPSPALRVGYLGQVEPHKGVDLLIDAWALLGGPRRRSLVIYGSEAGEADYGQHLRRQTVLADDVAWGGPFAPEAIWEILRDLDVIVVPSRWVENSPNVILEAQAVGVAVIGTDLGGVAEMVQHGWNGLLFQPDDAPDLAAQLQRLLDEPGLLTQLRRHQLPFQTLADEIDQIERLYLSVCTEDRPRPAVAREVAV